MRCNWNGFLKVLPDWMRQEVDEKGRDTLQELRLRLGEKPELVTDRGSLWLNREVKHPDLSFCLLAASGYSPWRAESMARGYVTAPGGHRIGLCGGSVSGRVSSLCLRVARDFPGIAGKLPEGGSVLILGAPGWGKTTLLRDLIRQRSGTRAVAVVDERGELFPEGFDRGLRVDVLTGVGKKAGIDRLLRTMGPGTIAVDEITEQADADAILRAAGCGAELLATAHAGSLEEFRNRPVNKVLVDRGIFQKGILLHRDKTFSVEEL